MSANGRDQVKSNTAFTISARVRSDFPIFSIACGWARNGDLEIIFDIMSIIDGGTSKFKVRFHVARQSIQSQTADTRHSSLYADGQVCPACETYVANCSERLVPAKAVVQNQNSEFSVVNGCLTRHSRHPPRTCEGLFRAHCVSPIFPLRALAALIMLRQLKIGAAAQRENPPFVRSAARI